MSKLRQRGVLPEILHQRATHFQTCAEAHHKKLRPGATALARTNVPGRLVGNVVVLFRN